MTTASFYPLLSPLTFLIDLFGPYRNRRNTYCIPDEDVQSNCSCQPSQQGLVALVFFFLPLGLSQTFQVVAVTDSMQIYTESVENKAGYRATPVACGWAGAVF